jgi:hypothetical protein
MLAYLSRFVVLARSKVTTYVALAMAGLSQLADHAESLVSSWPQITAFAPNIAVVQSALHWALTGLSALVIFTRIRRELSSKS